MLAARPSPTVALRSRDVFGDAPHWDSATGRLLRVDVTSRRVHAWDPASGAEDAVDAGMGVRIALPHSGGLALATDDRIVLVDCDGWRRVLCRIDSDAPGTRLCDGKCDPWGRLWIGTVALRDGARGGLYRVSGFGDVTPMASDLQAFNGLAFNSDGGQLYLSSARGRIDVFDIASATASPSDRRTLVKVEPAHGRPHGIASDSEGGIWVAMCGGSSVHRYDSRGNLDSIVDLPVTHPTSVAFGGAKLDRLYITSSRCPRRSIEVEAVHQPLAGSVLAIDPGVSGVPVAQLGP